MTNFTASPPANYGMVSDRKTVEWLRKLPAGLKQSDGWTFLVVPPITNCQMVFFRRWIQCSLAAASLSPDAAPDMFWVSPTCAGQRKCATGHLDRIRHGSNCNVFVALAARCLAGRDQHLAGLHAASVPEF